MNYLIRFPENRVRRNYKGGLGIDKLKNKEKCEVSNKPEEWIASLVTAKNPGLSFVENEGLSYTSDNILFLDLIKENPEFYLGEEHYKKFGMDLGFLTKILDSAMRLHVQAHPTKEFSKKHLNCNYGKLECYYILSAATEKPYIRLGFQNKMSKAEWKRIIENQDIAGMDSCFEKIPVNPGEVWLVPGGLAHAIGEGITMMEIMEPTDLVVRCEFNREGIIVPPEARFMGKDLDFCLDIFDYTKMSKEEITKKYKLTPEITIKDYELKTYNIPDCFSVNILNINKNISFEKNNRLFVGVLLKGSLTIEVNGEKMSLSQGDSFFTAAKAEKINFETENTCEILFVQPC